MVAQLPAVVAPENDDGVIGKTLMVERVEQSADLGVGIADAGVVAVSQRLGKVGRNGVAFRHVGVGVQLTVVMPGKGRGAVGQVVDQRQGNFLRVVQVPVFLRRDERQMRLEKADGKEERAALLPSTHAIA